MAQPAICLSQPTVRLAKPAVRLAKLVVRTLQVTADCKTCPASFKSGPQRAICLAQPAVRAFKVLGGWHSWLYAWHSWLCVGGPCDYCVSLSLKNWVLGFSDLVRTLGLGSGACWERGLGLGLGLDNYLYTHVIW